MYSGLNPVLMISLWFGAYSLAMASVAEKNVKWDHHSISVCWGEASDSSRVRLAIPKSTMAAYILEIEGWKKTIQEITPFRDSHRRGIQEIISSEFQISRTGIEFVGWTPCSENSEADAIILGGFQEMHPYGSATVGQNGILKSDGMGLFKDTSETKPHVFLSLSRSEESVDELLPLSQFYALHVFGHLTALRHEHIRVGEKDLDGKVVVDENCTLSPPVSDSFGIGSTAEFYSTYDPSSVMNYCRQNFLEKVGFTYVTKTDSNGHETLISPAISAPILLPVDSSLFTHWENQSGGVQHSLRSGLSQGDLHTLSCMYKSDEEYPKENCRKDYDPIHSNGL